MSSALASATCYSILALEGLTELLPELRDDVSMETGASFDTLALSLLDGHNDPVRLDRTAKRLWRRVLGDGPAAHPDDEPSQAGWASLRIKLDRCIHRAKGSLAQSLANQGLRASDDAVPTSTSGSVRTLTPTEESDMDARWLAAGRRQPGEMFAPSAQFLALMAKYLWPVGRADTTEDARGCADLAQDLLAGLVGRVPTARRQVIIDGHQHGVQLHDGVLIDTYVLGNGDRLPLGLIVLSINHVHCRTAPRFDVIECERPVAEEPEHWVREVTQHVCVVDVFDDEAKAFFEALSAARARRVSLVAATCSRDGGDAGHWVAGCIDCAVVDAHEAVCQ